MKALSLTQPWATLVAIGAKRIETRSWSSTYRGPLAIHASKAFPLAAQELCLRAPFWSWLKAAGLENFERLPRGAIVAVANLHAVGQIGRRRDGAVIVRRQELPVSADELAFGDYTPGRYGWRLTNVGQLKEPIPCRGALSLWAVPAEIAKVLEGVEMRAVIDRLIEDNEGKE